MYTRRCMTSLTLPIWGRGHEVRPFATPIGSDVFGGRQDATRRKRAP